MMMVLLNSSMITTLILHCSNLFCLIFWIVNFLLGCFNIFSSGLLVMYPHSILIDASCFTFPPMLTWGEEILMCLLKFMDCVLVSNLFFIKHISISSPHCVLLYMYEQFILVLNLFDDCCARISYILVLPKKWPNEGVCYFIWSYLFLFIKC